MIDVTVYTHNGSEHAISRDETLSTNIFSDEYIHVTSSADVPNKNVFIGDGVVCVLAGSVFNGESAKELYNRYGRLGRDGIEALDGHFVLVVYSTQDRQVAIFRDRGGFRHGYYWHSGVNFVFSTSLSTVLDTTVQQFAFQHRVNRAGLASYLAFQYLPSPQTPFEGVFQFPLQAALHIQAGGDLQVQQWPHFPSTTPDLLSGSFEEHTNCIQEILVRSAQAQIEPGRKIGAFLSGGMDTSTNIALMVEQLGLQPVALTATFREESYNELEFARMVAERYKIEHLVVQITPEMIDVLPEIVKLYETPHGDRSIFAEYFLCHTARQHGCVQLATGEGGDEIMGYPRSRDGNASFAQLPTDADALARWYLEATTLSPALIRNKMLTHLNVDIDVGSAYLETLYKQYGDYAPFERLYFGQWQTWLIDGVYMKDSRVLRHFAINPVLPFMNSELMEYMSRLPLQTKLDGLDDKKFLKTALKHTLPSGILTKTKHKFWLPFTEWFRGGLQGYLRETLLRTNSFVCGYYGREHVTQLITDHTGGTEDHSRVLWGLLFLEVWYAEYARKWL